MLAAPRIVVLDSSTLGNVSRDFWSTKSTERGKARSFLARLQDLGVLVTFTLTHVSELLRRGSEQVVQDRLAFLARLPLIAWLRPYDRNWFPGSLFDLLCRELHAVIHGVARSWPAIVDEVRRELWETGVGSEMFVANEELWSGVSCKAEHQHHTEMLIASVAKTDPGHIMDTTLDELLRCPVRQKGDQEVYVSRFAKELKQQLDRHGDKRLNCSEEIAAVFANRALQDSQIMSGENPIARCLSSFGVPAEAVSGRMTVGQIGDLAVYATRLRAIAEKLRPRVKVTVLDVPPDTLPTNVLHERLRSIQGSSHRVSGSDFGDACVAPLLFYADAVQVDKRTDEHLKQVRRDEPTLAYLMGQSFRSADYARIPRLLDQCGSEGT